MFKTLKSIFFKREPKPEIVYFSVNNWFCGRDFPNDRIFIDWIGKAIFQNDDWAKKNKLCIRWGYYDMSINYCITATKDWVEKNCPELLTNNEYEYKLCEGFEGKVVTYKNKYSNFVFHPDENGEVEDNFNWPFLEYNEENIGSHYYEHHYDEDCDEEDDEE